LQQPCLLLCYLLLNQHYPHQRDPLAGVFWSDCPNDLARKKLRNTLWRLRQYLEAAGAASDDYLFVYEDNVSFNTTSQYWLDVNVFEAAVERCRNTSPQQLSPEQVRDLETAVELYVGDLLQGVYADWCLYDRERLRMDYISSLGKLMHSYGLSGDYEQGLKCGEKILSFDSTREKVYQHMMWLHFLAGNRKAALSQYKRCQQVLQDELGIVPTVETRWLKEMILSSSTHPADLTQPQVDTQQQQAYLSRPDEPFIRTALEKLHFLQLMVDHAGAELRLLESMICGTVKKPDSLD
jgi:DNA-binding SARP family transcriptional activator